MKSIQYTVRGVPEGLDAELRKEAQATGRTLNAVVVETLEQAKRPAGRVHDDLNWFVGSASGGASADEGAALTWLDSLPSELS